jgi:hypothetical protein
VAGNAGSVIPAWLSGHRAPSTSDVAAVAGRVEQRMRRWLRRRGLIDERPVEEREFQNFAKLRLNMLFAGSSEGAHRACVLLGIIATCRALGIPVQAYLAWVFEHLGTHREAFGLALNALTPAAFKAARG